MTERPWLYVVAGPNGAGKSTLAALLLPDVVVVNPDNIARMLNPAAPESSAFAAGRRALAEVRVHIEAGLSFGLETTLAGRWVFRAMAQARRRGYGLMVLYVGIESKHLAIRRVAARVRAGGHDVPAEDVRRRYQLSLSHLSEALAIADQAVLYDNSARAEVGPRIFAEVENGVIVALEPERPAWFSGVLRRVDLGTDLRG